MSEEHQDAEVGWAVEEFSEVDLDDKRLDRRCQELAEKLGKQPMVSINQACEDWADSKAAYRFVDNEKVSARKLLKPHTTRTIERMKNHKLVLAVQDTTFLNFTSHPKTKGLGEIGAKKQHQRGFGLHSTLIVTPQGQPLGLLDQAILERPVGQPALKPGEAMKQPIEQKESYRWVESFEKTIKLTPDDVQVVTVCDREADIYEMFVTAQEHQASLLVRADNNRRLEDDQVKHLWSKVEQQSVQGELTVHMTGNDKRKARHAVVAVRFCTVKLRPPWRPAQKKLPSVTLQAILVREENPPENLADLGDHEPIAWMLLTNTPVTNFEEAVQVIEWYCCRWQIEVFHKIIKSGCLVENSLLQTAKRLQNYIALMCVIAWRLHWLTYLNRTDPDLPCIQILTTVEWQALYMRIHKTTKFPEKLPTVRQAVRWIAQLGGFLGRKADGEPGMTVIWRGWQRLQDLADTWAVIVNDQPQLVGNR
ncbi:MAG: IS4 family transposase [Anaerolineae bacterium]|nr:IS4 family transposase [Anaerolineae bacterium]